MPAMSFSIFHCSEIPLNDSLVTQRSQLLQLRLADAAARRVVREFDLATNATRLRGLLLETAA